MAVIEQNRAIADGIFELALSGVPIGNAGQFLQVHLPDTTGMLLPRPISLFDADEKNGVTRLVYRIVGRGTNLLSTLDHGSIRVTGPLGNGFPVCSGDAVLIGGGLGIAPLYLLCKQLRAAEPERKITVALGYSDRIFLKDAFDAIADCVAVNIGGYVTEDVDFSQAATFYACGPAPMMRACAKLADAQQQKLYVSLESRMACGVGACYACSIRTIHGNRRVCKDGPVFLSSEVYYG